jgi:hypothetical protein
MMGHGQCALADFQSNTSSTLALKVAFVDLFLSILPFLPQQMAEKPSGYRLEYALSARAKCKGHPPFISSFPPLLKPNRHNRPETMSRFVPSTPLISNPISLFLGTTIEKGQLRLGSLVDFRGNTSLYAPLPSFPSLSPY